MVLCSGGGCLFFKDAPIQQTVFLQIDQRLRELLQIEGFGPTCITSTLAFLQLGLNVDKQTAAGFDRGICELLLFRSMLLGSGNARAKILRGISWSQRIHADESFLISSQQGWNLTTLDLIAGAMQQLQQFFKALWLLCQSIINGVAYSLPVGWFLLIAQLLVISLAFAVHIFFLVGKSSDIHETSCG